MDIRKLLDHPNFGRLYTGSSHVKGIVNDLVKRTGDMSVTEAMNKAKVVVDPNGQLALHVPELDHTFTRRSSESIEQFFERVIHGDSRVGVSTLDDPIAGLGINSSLRTSQTWTSSRVSTNVSSELISKNRGHFRRGIETVAEQSGATLRYRTFTTGQDHMQTMLGSIGRNDANELLGLVIPGDISTGVLEAFDASGRKMTSSEIFGIFNMSPNVIKSGPLKGEWEPSVFKRIRGLINEQQIGRSLPQGQRFQIGLFNPEKFFNQDTKVASQIASLGDKLGKRPTDAMIDGLSFQSRSAFDRSIKAMEQELWAEQRNYQRLKNTMSRHEREAVERQHHERAMDIRKIKEDVANGRSYNTRFYGGESMARSGKFKRGAIVHNTKGDTVVLDDDVFRSVLRKTSEFSRMSEEKFEEVFKRMDLLISNADPKEELQLTDNFISQMTMSPQGMPDVANSNAITTSVFGEAINPVDANGVSYLEQSLNISINDAVESIRKGQAPAGFRQLVEEYENLRPEDFEHASDYYAALDNKQYVERMRNFLDSGGDLSTDSVMSKEMLRIVKEHHFRFSKGRYNQTINVAGEEIPDLAMKIPMQGSTRAHAMIQEITDMASVEEWWKNPTMVVDINNQFTGPGMYDRHGNPTTKSPAARFNLRGPDNRMLQAAFGGSDLDDSFYSMYRYDTTTKRLYALMLRDPNTVGEYALLDANIVNDPSFSPNARSLAAEKIRLNHALARAQQRGEDLGSVANQRLIARRDKVLTELDVEIRSHDFVRQINIAKQYSADVHTAANPMYAPKGWQTTAESLAENARPDFLRSNLTSAEIGESLSSSIARAKSNELAGRATGPFELRGGDFSEYAESGYFKRDRKTKARARGARSFDGYQDLRLAAQNRAKGLLGANVNQATVIDHFIRTHTSVDTAGSQEFADAIKKILRNNRLTLIDREDIIDAIVKTGDESIIAHAISVLDENARTFGKIIGAAQRQGLAAGLDPAEFAQRWDRNPNQVKALIEGYQTEMNVDKAEAMSRLLLAPDDVKADYTRLVSAVREQQEVLETVVTPQLVEETNANLLNKISEAQYRFTDEELVRAEEFLTGHQRDLAKHMGLVNDKESTFEALRKALDSDISPEDMSRALGEFSIDQVNRESIKRLHKWGLLGEDATGLNRQLMAIAQVAAENQNAESTFDALRALHQTSPGPGTLSVGELFAQARAAVDQDTATRRLTRSFAQAAASGETVEATSLLRDYIFRDAEGNILMDPKIHRFARPDKFRNNMLVMTKWLRDRGATVDSDIVRHLQEASKEDDLARQVELDALWDRQQRIQNTLRDEPLGVDRLAGRTLGDAASESIAGAKKFKSMKQLDMQYMSDLLSKPGFRKGLGAAALFAGLGLVDIFRGDRTPEDMEGPPLLPGGSAYESDFDDVAPIAQSIYTSAGSFDFPGGTTYRVAIGGQMDVNRVQNHLRSVIDVPMTGTIHERSVGPYSSPTSSIDLLNSLYE